jgi:hypothetical protein
MTRAALALAHCALWVLALGAGATLAQEAGAPPPATPSGPANTAVPNPTQTPAQAPASTPVRRAPSEDRITFSANGSSLTGTSGGGGAAGGWLHNFNPDTLLGAAVEYEALSVAHWTFGSLNGSMTRGPSNQRYTLSGEIHEGAGDDGPKAFKYRVEALSLSGTYFHRFTATVEDRQLDVETTHGNLPKVALSYLATPHFQAALAYQYSVSGNLDTRLTSGRLDFYEPLVNFFAGFGVGRTSPTVIGQVGGGTVLQSRQFREGYVGVSRPLVGLRSDITLIADYQHLQGTEVPIVSPAGAFFVPGSNRWTGTLNWVYHIPH